MDSTHHEGAQLAQPEPVCRNHSQIRFYTAALALAPENHLLRFSRANALLQLGKTAEATRDALVLVRVMPIWYVPRARRWAARLVLVRTAGG